MTPCTSMHAAACLLCIVGQADARPQAAVITHEQADGSARRGSQACDAPPAFHINVDNSCPPEAHESAFNANFSQMHSLVPLLWPTSGLKLCHMTMPEQLQRFWFHSGTLSDKAFPFHTRDVKVGLRKFLCDVSG